MLNSIRRAYRRVQYIRCALIHPAHDIHVSFSALAVIKDGGSYLLARSLHCPESFGPVGGIYKHQKATALDELEFKQEVTGEMERAKNDLRGILPRRNLAKLAAWFQSGKDRETGEECLQRKFVEAHEEAQLPATVTCPDFVSFRFVRSVHEGPDKVAEQACAQYRIFHVYKVDESNAFTRKLISRLVAEARNGQENLILATTQEIIFGRSASGEQIDHNAGYLLGSRRVRPDTTIFEESLPAVAP